MNQTNSKINVEYLDTSNNKTHLVSGTGLIMPFNEISSQEMGYEFAYNIAKNHASHSDIKVISFTVEQL